VPTDWTFLPGCPRALNGNLEYTSAHSARDGGIARGLVALDIAFENALRSFGLSALHRGAVEDALGAALAVNHTFGLESFPLRRFLRTIHYVRTQGSWVDLAYTAAQSWEVRYVSFDLDAKSKAKPPAPLPVALPDRPKAQSRKQRFEAAGAGDLALVSTTPREMLDDADEFGRTLLSHACGGLDAEVVRWLLDAGASPTAHTIGALFFRYPKGKLLDVERGPNHTLLHIAAWHHGPAIVALLIERGFDVDARDPYGATPLMQAAMRDTPEAGATLEVLLAKGASVELHDATGATALDHAAEIVALKLLLGAGAVPSGGPVVEGTMASPGAPALERWASEGNLDAVELLLERGAVVPGALAAAARIFDEASALATIEVFLRHSPSKESLDRALAAATKRAIAERLITAGATSLDAALSNFILQPEHAKWLIAQGARARSSAYGHVSALMIAARAASAEAFELALSADPDLGDRDEQGRTALHHAALAGDVSFVRALVERGADVMAADAQGLTPYAYAKTAKAYESVRQAVTFLAEHGGGPPEPKREAQPAAPAAPLLAPTRPVATSDLDLDDVVAHARFGRGTVLDVDGTGATARVTVDFDGKERVLPASTLRRISAPS
jgi:ankyrin repeat protein